MKRTPKQTGCSVKKKPAKKHSDTCSVNGCDKPYFSKGFCKLHYSRNRHGVQSGGRKYTHKGIKGLEDKLVTMDAKLNELLGIVREVK
jgi:hypothetical protein